MTTHSNAFKELLRIYRAAVRDGLRSTARQAQLHALRLLLKRLGAALLVLALLVLAGCAEAMHPGHCTWSGTFPCGNHRCCLKCAQRCGW